MPGTQGALRLIERTAAGLCRALSGSVDLLEHAVSAENGSAVAVHEATSALVNQMRLREAAWGPADDPLPLHQLNALAQGLPNGVVVDLSALPAAIVFPAALGQIVLNILILAADSLPLGGQVVLAGAPDDLLVQIAGPTAAWPVGLALCLTNEAEANAALTERPKPADGADRIPCSCHGHTTVRADPALSTIRTGNFTSGQIKL